MAEEPRAMTQEEIDTLFANLSTSLPAIPGAQESAPSPEPEAPPQPEPTAPAPEPAAPTDNGPLGQDDIDALLREMDSSTKEPAAQRPPNPSATDPSARMTLMPCCARWIAVPKNRPRKGPPNPSATPG